MATTIHLPEELLERLDRHASDLGVSRNLYIRRALEAALESETAWSRDFLRTLEEAAKDEEAQSAVEEMMRVISSSRRSRKRSPDL